MIDIALLRQIPLFADLQDEQLGFVHQGQERLLEPDEVLVHEGETSGAFWVLLEGEICCTKRVGDRQLHWLTYSPRSYFGHELILLNRPMLTTAQATCSCRLIEFDTSAFWKMLELCPFITRELLVSTAQRSQNLDALSLRTQKLMSLGTLTAGLAQELREPSDGSRFAVQKLQKTFEFLQTLVLRLNQKLPPDQQSVLIDIQEQVLDSSALALAKTDQPTCPKDQGAIATWLEANGVTNVPYCEYLASALARVNLGIWWLEKVKAKVAPDIFEDVLLWIKTTLTGMLQVDAIERGTLHISQLVQAAKDYTYLDQAPLQEMDIHDGLESTIRMLSHRLNPGVTVMRDYDRTLPVLCVYGSDLNQVWTHLIDNAIDAMNHQGQLQIRTYRDGNFVVVDIIDSGVGIPPEIQSRIFDQFFTTKSVGEGTGLGLPIAYHVVVEQHRGMLDVESRPGQTCFRVALPMDLRESLRFQTNPQLVYRQ